MKTHGRRRGEAPQFASHGNFNPTRLLRKCLIFAYGYFLLFLFRDGIINLYLSERLQFIGVAGAIILIGASVAYSSFDNPPGENAVRKTLSRGGRAAAVALCVMLLVPVALGFAKPPAPLGMDEIKEHGNVMFSNLGGTSPPDILSRPGPGDALLTARDAKTGRNAQNRYAKINLMELSLIVAGSGDTFKGNLVAVQGFSAKAPGHKEDAFALNRYLISCCVVHAQLISLTVAQPGNVVVEPGKWVTVYGRIHPQPNAPEGQLPYTIDADKIEFGTQPADPYISKWNTEKPFKF